MRTQRVGKEIQRIISDLLTRGELHDPRFAGMISFTKVDVAPDLRTAKVYFSCFGNEEDAANTDQALESARGFIQSEVASMLVIRYSPKLTFVRDESIAYGDKIERILNDINVEHK
ncbi:30S ribosome-binding factor RbfA [bacterium]|nr:30S ribosome-binding factor RbfA [bacterium]